MFLWLQIMTLHKQTQHKVTGLKGGDLGEAGAELKGFRQVHMPGLKMALFSVLFWQPVRLSCEGLVKLRALLANSHGPHAQPSI